MKTTKTIITAFLLLFSISSFAQKKSDELRAWQTFEENGKFGYRYSDYGNITVTIPAKFEHKPSDFVKGSKYTQVQKTFDTKAECPCRKEAYDKYGIKSYAIINRKGEEVISPPNNNTGYQVLQPTIFALEIGYQNSAGEVIGCSAKIINIETKEIIAELPSNQDGNQVRIQSKYLMRASSIDFDNSLFGTQLMKKTFAEKLEALYTKEKFDYILIYPEDFKDSQKFEKQKALTAYLFWNDGKHKTIQEEWLKEH